MGGHWGAADRGRRAPVRSFALAAIPALKAGLASREAMSCRTALASLVVIVVIAVSGCTHVDTDLPDVPGSGKLGEVEIQSNVDDSWGRYQVLIGDDSTTAWQLTKRIRRALHQDGWEMLTRPAGYVSAKSSSKRTGIDFGPARGMMRRYVPRRVVAMARNTPGLVSRKVLVAIREWAPE
jgi:hypothetical protein